MATLLAFCLEKIDPNHESLAFFFPFFERRIFVGPALRSYTSETLRTVPCDSVDAREMMEKVAEPIDMFVTGHPSVVGVGAVDALKYFIIPDSHFHAQLISKAIAYLQTERYDGVLVTSRPEHCHFFLERGIKACHYPVAPISENLRMRIQNIPKKKDVCYIGHRHGRMNRRANRMTSFLEKKLGRSGGRFDFVQHCRFEDYILRLAESRMAICCTANSQFTPQIYLIMQSGALCLLDRPSRFSSLPVYFQEDVHYVGWDNFEELLSKIEHLLAHPEQLNQIAQSGQKRAWECFREFHRLDFFEHMKSESIDMIRSHAEEFDTRVRPLEGEQDVDLEKRLEVYQVLQTLHRCMERVEVLFVQVTQTGFVSDAFDLPRVDAGTLACPGFPDHQTESVSLDVVVCPNRTYALANQLLFKKLKKSGIVIFLEKVSEQEQKSLNKLRLTLVRLGVVQRVLDRMRLYGSPIFPKIEKITWMRYR